ncbi:DNA polymerase III, beta subunit [Sphingomonas gellani]|uniref:Beta sliding clamp n=1 Tax=Sphingomonas gellani TaxID=1166340 RepID=A0A1H8C3A1_9SPHN|nr:DNA polymerase III subunit beta [Sphingomonas gellani]SEM88557.1 DNA polymerase III, beta subunit [Sphingomonas gellani]
MSVEVDRDALLGAVRRVADVVEARTTIPVLGNLLIEAAEGKLTLTGTDLDLQASATIDAAGTMSITVDKNKLLAAVTSFKPGRIAISAVPGRQAVQMKAGRGSRILSTLPATDFPKREALANATAFDIRASAFLRLLDTTSIAHSTDETRYYLKGAFLHVRGDQLMAAATDGHKAVQCRMTVPTGAEQLPDIIVPTKAVTLLRKLLTKVDGEVRFGATHKAYECQVGGTLLIGNLVDATFPDYQRVIPDRCDRALIGARDALLDPLTQVAAIVDAEGEKKIRVAVIDLQASPAESEVSAKDATGATAVEALDVEVSGEPIRFGVNQRYLSLVLGVFAESSRIELSLADPAAPMRLTGDKDPDVVAVITPYRI